MNLSVGLTHNSAAWEQWCSQEGVPWSMVRFDDLLGEYAVIVITAVPDREQSAALEHFVRGGGAVLAYVPHAAGVLGAQFRYESVDYLLPAGRITDTGLLDLDLRCAIPTEANALLTSAGSPALFVGPVWGGHAALLPFDLNDVLHDCRSETRQFPAERERLPFERVSTVAKGEALFLIGRLVELLFASRGLPLVRKARFPDGGKTVSLFRVDSDGGSRDEVVALHERARRHGIPMTWFLDVKSHASWIEAFANMEGDEIALHCYDHQVFPDYHRNLNNIRTALSILSPARLEVQGFAAPQGGWNENLAAAIDDSGFTYSSEFSYMYDGFPLYPQTPARTFATLQIPIHPICIGSLRRVGYSEPQMISYFTSVIDRKLARGEPLLMYHHPRDVFPSAIDGLLDLLHSSGPAMTMGQFAHWWRSRSEVSFSANAVGDSLIEIRHDAAGQPVRLEIVRPDGCRAIAPLDARVELAQCRWDAPVRHAIHHLRRARTFDLRTAIADIYTNVTRWIR